MLCDYGCGQEAIHQFKNGKWCCSKSFVQCPHQRKLRKHWIPWHKGKTGVYSDDVLKQMSARNKKENRPKEVQDKMNESLKGREPWNKGLKGCFSDEALRKKSESSKGRHVWNKGLTGCYSKETLKKISESGKGREPWNKGKVGVQVAWNKGKKQPEKTKRKISKSRRLTAIKQIEERKLNGDQLYPNYNPTACRLIDAYGEQHGYTFQHAENGGEYHIKELGYWVDGYDAERNTVIEVDEAHHFDNEGNLTERDIRRQAEIESYLGCEFIRIRI